MSTAPPAPFLTPVDEEGGFEASSIGTARTVQVQARRVEREERDEVRIRQSQIVPISYHRPMSTADYDDEGEYGSSWETSQAGMEAPLTPKSAEKRQRPLSSDHKRLATLLRSEGGRGGVSKSNGM
jgi:hypothetical protein